MSNEPRPERQSNGRNVQPNRGRRGASTPPAPRARRPLRGVAPAVACGVLLGLLLGMSFVLLHLIPTVVAVGLITAAGAVVAARVGPGRTVAAASTTAAAQVEAARIAAAAHVEAARIAAAAQIEAARINAGVAGASHDRRQR